MYRAVVFTPENHPEIALTGPEHAHLSDLEIGAQAMGRVYRKGLIGSEWPRITEDALINGIRLTWWHDDKLQIDDIGNKIDGIY